MRLFHVYRITKEKKATKLRLWRFVAVAESEEDAVAITKEENHGDLILPEETRIVWVATAAFGRTSKDGLVYLMASQLTPTLRTAWEKT